MPETKVPLVARRKLLGAGVEGTKGTAASVTTPLATTNVYDAVMSPGDIFSDGERLPISSTAGSLPRTKGAQMGTLSFQTEMVFEDAFMTLIQACGYKVTSKVAVQTLDISEHKTLTFVLWEGGRKKTLRGASGTVSFEAAGAGGRLMLSWEFTGIYDGTADQVMPAHTPLLTKGWRAQAMTLTLASGELPQVDGISLNLNSDVQPREDVLKAEGLTYFLSIPGVPVLTIGPEARLVTDYDAHGKFLAGTPEALSIIFTDASSNTFTIASPKAQRVSLGDEDRNLKLVDPVDMELHKSTGNDAITMTESA